MICSLPSLVDQINLFKIESNFLYFKTQAGSLILSLRYNNFFERIDPFGIKISSLNIRRLREGRSSLGFLRMLRRLSRDSYGKFTNNTEVQYNLLHNSFLSSLKTNILNRSLVNFARSSKYQLYVSRLVSLRNLARPTMSLSVFASNVRMRFFVRSQFFYGRFSALNWKRSKK
jgi:hypothetical protein